MSYTKIETWEELDALPVGSQIAFNVHSDCSDSDGVSFAGVTTFERGDNGGWWVIEDTTTPAFVGYGPLSSESFRKDYERGSYFSLVITDATEVAA